MNNYHLKEKEEYLNTINIGELIEILKTFPNDKEVFVTWEGTISELKKDFIYEAQTGSIYIDGDYAFYKGDFKK